MAQPGTPTNISDVPTRPIELAREPVEQQASLSHVDLRVAAAQFAVAAIDAATRPAQAQPSGEQQPLKQPRVLPAWLSVVLAFSSLTTGGGLALGLQSLGDDEEIKAIRSEFSAEVKAIRAEVAADRETLAKDRDTLAKTMATLHTNDAALGKWAVDFSSDVSEGLVSLDALARAIAEKQGIDTSKFAAPSIAKPGPTVRGLGVQGEVEGL